MWRICEIFLKSILKSKHVTTYNKTPKKTEIAHFRKNQQRNK